MSQAKSVEEVRELMLDSFRNLAAYWAKLPNLSPLKRCNGLAFSILNIFDGSTMDLPAMDILLAPHEDDKEYHIQQDENWFEPGMMINDCMLHELYYNKSDVDHA